MNRARYERVSAIAGDAAHFGYVYRKYYERQTRAKAAIAPSEVLRFVALAALGGIIGNATWEFVRTRWRRIADQCKTGSLMDERGNVLRLLSNGDEEQKFRDYVRDFFLEKGNVPPAVRVAVLEEIRADLIGKSIGDDIGQWFALPPKERVARIRAASDAALRSPSEAKVKDELRSLERAQGKRKKPAARRAKR